MAIFLDKNQSDQVPGFFLGGIFPIPTDDGADL
ncbi:hypothetical protein HNP46_002890 [Pseudomonas nitritireducens]|uniref:Uncharacterized protein n=1 Tax=Pseudomonas nitroreducens TaxID=46680 RepID=A0A7W7KKB5_PSENT|nr:hypothetical protein [Pseudomonas nitritireducens]